MKNYPVIKFSLIFICGIILHQVFTVDFILITVIAAVTIILFFISKYFNKNNFIYVLKNIIVFLFILLCGNKLADLNYTSSNNFFDERRFEKDVTIYGTVSKIELLKSDLLVFYVEADSLISEAFSVKDDISVLCKFRDTVTSLNKFYAELSPGNKVELTGYFYKGMQRRNPGEFDYDNYLTSIGIIGILSINSAENINITSNATNLFQNIVHQLRKGIDERIKLLHSKSTANLLRGLLLADRKEIDYETRTSFINAGVIHVLAVSGLHIGFIALIFYFLFGRFNLHLRSALTIFGLIAFMLITGIPPSVFRATVMAVVIILAFVLNRSTNIFNSIAIAALIILIIDPNEIYSAGFQLSFSAVISIGVVYPILEKWIKKLNIRYKSLEYVILFMAVSLSAQIGTLPLTLIYFGKFSVIALFTNLVVIPAIGIIIGLAFITLLLSLLSTAAAIVYASANDFISNLMFEFINYTGRLKFSHILINNYSMVDTLIFYTFTVVLIIVLIRFNSPLKKAIAVILVLANIFLFSGFDDKILLPEGKFNVMMIDVGQGDSFLLQFPNGETTLIDAGNVTPNFDYGERVILPLLNYFDIDKIDYAFISHIDSDHYGGFVSLIYYDKINKIFTPPMDTSSEKDIKFHNFLHAYNVSTEIYSSQKNNYGGVQVYILTDENFGDDENLSSNNKSAVLKFVYGNVSFLFTGDIEKKAEAIYSYYYKNFLDVDILKVAHHGSKTGSSNSFLNDATPGISLISAGYKNQFGHPANEIVDRLKNYSSSIFRTDLNKAVILSTDGNEIHKINWE